MNQWLDGVGSKTRWGAPVAGAHALKPEAALFLLLCLPTALVSAQTFQTSGSDFLPRVVGGQIITDSHNDPANFDVSNVRVSPYEFGLITGDPYFTQDPGFNAPAGSNLPAGSILSFSILSDLFYWNGTGKVSLSPPPNGESLQYTFGINVRTIAGSATANVNTQFTSDSVVQPGFFIGTVNSDGSLHKHLNAFLLNAQGSADPSSGNPPAAGIYFASIELTDSDPSTAKSSQLYVMYSNGMNTCQQIDARIWLRDHFAPGTNLVFSPGMGDINLDGKVDFNDLLTLAQNYGSNNAAWCEGDLNSDGSVGFADLLLLAQHYGDTYPTSGPAAQIAAVPEPTILPALAALAAAIARRRGHSGKEGGRK